MLEGAVSPTISPSERGRFVDHNEGLDQTLDGFGKLISAAGVPQFTVNVSNLQPIPNSSYAEVEFTVKAANTGASFGSWTGVVCTCDGTVKLTRVSFCSIVSTYGIPCKSS